MSFNLYKISYQIFPKMNPHRKNTVTYDTLLETGTGDMIGNVHNKHYSVDGHELTSVLYTSALINGRGRFDERKLPLTEFNVNSGKRSRYEKIDVHLKMFQMYLEHYK